MTNLTESSIYEAGIYQLETKDPALGGPPGFDAGIPVTGHANVQAQQLANRTAYLNANKQPLSNNLTSLASLTGAADSLPYFTGAGALSLTTLTELARNLLDDTTQSGMQSTLGLVKQTSATDTTAGALMTVGAFGLGTDNQPTNIDPNTVRYGSVMVPVSQPNAPSTECVMWSGGQSAGARSSQLAIDHGAPTRAWIRGYNSGRVGAEWAPWTELWTSVSANSITVDTGSFGYGTGSGGTVTQATSKSTGVTLNKPSGQITTASDAIAANSAVSFTLTNDKIAANDIPSIVIKSGATAGAYVVQVDAVAAGSCRVSIRNMTAGSLSETLVLQFNIEKGATA